MVIDRRNRILDVPVVDRSMLLEHLSQNGTAILYAGSDAELTKNRTLNGFWAIYLKLEDRDGNYTFKKVMTTRGVKALVFQSIIGLFSLIKELNLPLMSVPLKEGDHVVWTSNRNSGGQDQDFILFEEKEMR